MNDLTTSSEPSMFDGVHFANGLLGMVDSLLMFYFLIITVRVILSWFSPDPYSRIVQILCGMTDPVLNAVRRRLPGFFWNAGLDFTPLIVLMLISVVRLFLGSLRL